MRSEILSYLPEEHPWRERIHWFPSIDSTNTQARGMALAGAPDGTVLFADHQTGGRGRMGRSFQSPQGLGIYMSVLLRFDCPPQQLMHLTCATAVAACDAVEQAVGIRPRIKWTNDLVLGKRKLAGILTELVTTPDTTCAIIGIGINCNHSPEDLSPEIRSFAGSLAMATGCPVDRARLSAALVERLQTMGTTLLSEKAELLRRYAADCVTLGQDISVLRGESVRHGHALGIDGDGALLVRYSDGTQEAVQSGEVSIRGMYGYI